MSEFTVYSVPGSPFGRAVLATLEEKGVSYRLSPVAPGSMRTPEHLSRHPFGRVPVLEHDGFGLYESQAILRYLDRVLPSPAAIAGPPREWTRR
jgi:glutathione S-transferase